MLRESNSAEAGPARNSRTTQHFGGSTVRPVSRRKLILAHRRTAIRRIAAKNNATSSALAGSTAQGADAAESDLDFVCEFIAEATLLDFAGLQLGLADLLGCEVDIIDVQALEAPCTAMLDDVVHL